MNLLAQIPCNPQSPAYQQCIQQYGTSIGASNSIIGTITNPLKDSYGDLFSGGLTLFGTNLIRLGFAAAGIYAFFNLIVAGYQYMTAGGDVKALTAAWNRIWQTLLGLVIIISSFALAVLFGYLIFGDPTYILNPKIYGPKL